MLYISSPNLLFLFFFLFGRKIYNNIGTTKKLHQHLPLYEMHEFPLSERLQALMVNGKGFYIRKDLDSFSFSLFPSFPLSQV